MQVSSSVNSTNSTSNTSIKDKSNQTFSDENLMIGDIIDSANNKQKRKRVKQLTNQQLKVKVITPVEEKNNTINENIEGKDVSSTSEFQRAICETVKRRRN
jgi:hypothetical protein